MAQSMLVKLILVSFIFCTILISCKQSAEQLMQEANQYYQKEDYNKAIELYDRVITLNDKIELAHFNRGKCYFMLDNYSKSLSDLNKILSSKPDGVEVILNPQFATGVDKFKVPYLEVLFVRGLVKLNMDSLKSAFLDFETCVYNNYEPGKCYLHMGDILYSVKKNNTACEYYKKSLLLGEKEAFEKVTKNCK